MIGFGAGEIIGSLVNGKLNDMLGINRFLYVCSFEMVLAYIFLFWYNQRNEFELWTAAFTVFWWGVQDSGITNFFLTICGF